MAKLKVLKMVVNPRPEGLFKYAVFDTNGSVIANRISPRAPTGDLFIVGLVTKNYNHKHAYSIKYLATSFGLLKTKSPERNRRPYGIAVVDEHKEGFKEWVKLKKEKVDSLTK